MFRRTRPPRPIDIATAAVAGYLAGTAPTADAITRVVAGEGVDLRESGSGNPGGVNAMDVLGKGWGYTILFADMAKGATACGIGRRLAGAAGANVAGAAAVIGHCFPVWKKNFRGGKGVAVSGGQVLATFPVYFPVDLGVAWGASWLTKSTFYGTSISCAAWVAAATVWWRRGWPNLWGPETGPALPLAAAASSILIWFKFATARRIVPITTPPGS